MKTTHRTHPTANATRSFRHPGGWSVVLLAFFALVLASAAKAAEECTFFGAHMLQPMIDTAPAPDGLLDVNCTVPLLGGCCFPLTTHKVTAALAAPAGITVVSGPEPASYDAIDCPVSGTPKAFATFRWRGRSLADDYRQQRRLRSS
jgi:hypothetical protein